MRRREFITVVGGAAAWPLAARAQQARKLPTIGFLGADPTAFTPWTNAFVSRLRELGWIENRTVAIEYRWSEGRDAEIAAEFVRINVDVIVTVGCPTVRTTRICSGAQPPSDRYCSCFRHRSNETADVCFRE